MDIPKMTTEAQADQTAPKSPTKKSYEAPAIIYRAPLEATAGLCSTFPGKAAFECSTPNS
ncbi:MAG: hypothetical protein L0Y55_13340 [Anaerolineales bacterium]|nr:hypothetical protein [Anaerolineales bacterium]